MIIRWCSESAALSLKLTHKSLFVAKKTNTRFLFHLHEPDASAKRLYNVSIPEACRSATQ